MQSTELSTKLTLNNDHSENPRGQNIRRFRILNDASRLHFNVVPFTCTPLKASYEKFSLSIPLTSHDYIADVRLHTSDQFLWFISGA